VIEYQNDLFFKHIQYLFVNLSDAKKIMSTRKKRKKSVKSVRLLRSV